MVLFQKVRQTTLYMHTAPNAHFLLPRNSHLKLEISYMTIYKLSTYWFYVVPLVTIRSPVKIYITRYTQVINTPPESALQN